MYLPTIEKILGSFQICKSKEIGKDEIFHGTQITRDRLNTTKNIHSNVSKAPNFPAYIDPSFGFEIQYLSNISYTTYRNQSNMNIYKNMTNTFFDFLLLIEITMPFVYHEYIHDVVFTLSVVPGFENLTKHNGLTLERLSRFSADLARTRTIGVNVTESEPINFKGNAAYKIVYTELDAKNQIVSKHMVINTLIGHNGYFEYGGYIQLRTIPPNCTTYDQLL